LQKQQQRQNKQEGMNRKPFIIISKKNHKQPTELLPDFQRRSAPFFCPPFRVCEGWILATTHCFSSSEALWLGSIYHNNNISNIYHNNNKLPSKSSKINDVRLE
jgi:hypothetical protein